MVKLYLLGTPRIEQDGADAGLSLRKAQALVAYLAIENQQQSRDSLATLFWPEYDQSNARANLRRTLYRISQALGENFLQVTQETVEIAAEAGLWVDVNEFQCSLAEWLPEKIPAAALSDEQQSQLHAAADLYMGDFMEGFSLPDSAGFDEWQFFTREALRQKLAGVLEQLAHSFLLQDNPSAGIPLARRWLALDQLHEPAHRLLMELYARAGQQSAALRQYDECRRLLDESLGISPEPQTVELYKKIRTRKEFQLPQETFEPPEVRYALSEDVHIAYQVLGSGPVDVLIITGFISHLDEIWKEPRLAAMLRKLAQSSRLILFDKRGVGLSDRVGYPPTLENTVDDVRAVMQAVGSEHVLLFGFSEGGPASLLFCATYPERTLGLILYGTMAKGKRASDYPWALTEEQYALWISRLQSTWGKPVPQVYFAPSHAQDSTLWEWFANLLRLGSTPGEVQRVLQVTRDIDVRHILPAIRVPTLILHRAGDRTIYVQAGRYLAEHIPQSRYVEMPGDDHWFWLGDSESVLREIGAFVSDLRPPKVPDRSLATLLCMQILRDPQVSDEQLHWLALAVQQQLERYRGQLRVESQSMRIATFNGPSRALQCAQAINRLSQQRDLPVRIALHTGECLIAENDLRGPAVEIAKAVMQAAEEGEILLSHTVKDLVVGADFSFKAQDTLQLEDGLGSWKLYTIETK